MEILRVTHFRGRELEEQMKFCRVDGCFYILSLCAVEAIIFSFFFSFFWRPMMLLSIHSILPSIFPSFLVVSPPSRVRSSGDTSTSLHHLSRQNFSCNQNLEVALFDGKKSQHALSAREPGSRIYHWMT